MSNIKILKEYKKKIKLIKKFNKFYYDKSSPIVLDSDYDKLKNEIISLEKKYNYLKSPDSPSKIVGHKFKNFTKAAIYQCSLANAFDEGDLINFEKVIKFS